MNRLPLKTLILLAMIAGGTTGGVLASLQPPPRLASTVSPQPTATPVPPGTPTPVAQPSPSPAPESPPAVLAASTAVPLVAQVKPTVKPGVPLLCQSQAYSPEREAKCPHAEPTKKVSLNALNSAATTPAALPSVPVATATPFPSPTATPLSTLTPAAQTPPPTPAPTATPSPTAPPIPQDPNCGGGYPALLCQAAQDTLVDPWGMYNRECTSYAAFKVSQSGRKMPYWGGRGNANQWPANARAAGILVDSTPRPGDVAVSMAGPFGHAMFVEAVSDTRVRVSQYNYGAPAGAYSEMIVPIAGLLFIHFP